MFDDLFELDRVFELLDEASNYPSEIDLEWITSENSEFEKLTTRLTLALAETEREHRVPIGTSYQSKIISDLRDMLRYCDSSIELKAILNNLKILMLKAMIIGVELKSGSLELLAGKAKPFINHAPKGLDKLSHELLQILKRLGKKAKNKEILKELKNMAYARHPVIQEIDNDCVWWISSNGEKNTTLSRVEKRLTDLRKKI